MQCWHRLALALHRTVDELKDVMTFVEFVDWQAYFDLHPFGSEWDDVRMAVLSANIVTALTGKRQEIKKHLARYRQPGRARQSPKQQLMILTDYMARVQAWQKQPT